VLLVRRVLAVGRMVGARLRLRLAVFQWPMTVVEPSGPVVVMVPSVAMVTEVPSCDHALTAPSG
jgi:hypothetical protein